MPKSIHNKYYTKFCPSIKLTRGHTRKNGKGIMSHEQILYFATRHGKFYWGIGFGEKNKCKEMVREGLLKKCKRPSNWRSYDGELYAITNKGREVYSELIKKPIASAPAS